MKRRFQIAIASALAALLFTQCKKQDDPNAIFNTSFYTTNANGERSLYVNGSYKGVLPYFANEPACGSQNGDGQLPMTLQLKTGEYRIVGKDRAGREFSSSIVYIGTSTNSISGGHGGGSLSNNGDCVVIGLFE